MRPLAYYVDTTELEIAITTVGSVTLLPPSPIFFPSTSPCFTPSILVCVFPLPLLFYSFFSSLFLFPGSRSRGRSVSRTFSLVTSLVFFPGSRELRGSAAKQWLKADGL